MIPQLIAKIVILVQGLEAQCYEMLFFQHLWNLSAAWSSY